MTQRELLGHIDFHLHTIHSNCGKAGMTPTRAAKILEAKGYHSIGFTDHFDPVLSREKVRQIGEEISELNTSMDIFLGSEVSVYLPKWPREEVRRLRREHLDFCIMSPSHRPSGAQAEDFCRLPLEIQSRKVLDSFIEAIRGSFADAIAHPFAYGTSQITMPEEVLCGIDEYELSWALETARDNEIAIEFSPRVLGVPRTFLVKFIKLCKDSGVKFSIGSDAHSPESIGNDKQMLPLVREFDLRDDDFWIPERS